MRSARIAHLKLGASGDSSGDTLACRVFHLGLATASADAATTHCPHASASGGGVCVSAQATSFCSSYDSTCASTGKGAAYSDCTADVTAMSAGTLS